MRASISIVLLAALAFGGCRISREVINPHVRGIDVSWVEPGVTTREEVIRRLGMPPTVRGLGGVGKNQFRWTMVDTGTKTLEAGYIVTPTFEYAREYFADDILIRFDSHDVVSLVSRVGIRDGKRKLLLWKEARP